jgi:hypothetical protein
MNLRLSFIFLFGIILISCNKNKERVINVNSYYDIIHLAEIDISNNDYKNAETLYQSAFGSYDYMFAKDLNNAIRCSVLLSNWKNASFFAEKLMLKGVDLNYFEDSFFNNFRNTTDWVELSERFENINAVFKESYNEDFLSSISDLVKLDQSEYCEILENDNYNELKSNLTPKIDNSLSDLINKYGFPSEEKIGVNLIDNQTVDFTPIYKVLYIHSFQSGDNQLIDDSKKYRDSLLLDKRFISNVVDRSSFVQTSHNDSVYIDNQLTYDGKLKIELEKIKFNLKNSDGFILSNQGLVLSDFSDSISQSIFYKFHKPIGILNLN